MLVLIKHDPLRIKFILKALEGFEKVEEGSTVDLIEPDLKDLVTNRLNP